MSTMKVARTEFIKMQLSSRSMSDYLVIRADAITEVWDGSDYTYVQYRTDGGTEVAETVHELDEVLELLPRSE